MRRELQVFAILITLVPATGYGQDWHSHASDGTSENDTMVVEDSFAPADLESTSSGVQSNLVSMAYGVEDETACCSCCEHGGSGCNCLWCRKELTGDWWGRRTCLAEHGIVYKASITQFYQGVTSGGAEQRFRYGDKIDQYLILDSGKLGLWEGGKLIIHGDTQLGQSSIADAVEFAPANTAMLTPLIGQPRTAITHFQFEQDLGHGYAGTVGKFNFLDLWTAFYPDYGRGLDGFMNTSSIIFLNVVPTLPLIFDGAGLIKAGDKGIEAAVMFLDTNNIPTVSGLNTLFDNGGTVLGVYRFFTEFGGLPGSHLFAGTWSSTEFESFEPAGWITSRFGGVFAGLPSPKADSWLAAYVLDQTLWMDPCNKQRKVWLTSTWGIADPETSPFAWMGTASIEAIGLNPNREHDRMGISYWYNDVSDDLKALVPAIGIQDVQGGEVYYNAEITPWFHLTADLQVIQPALESDDAAVVLGLRGKIDL
jgi:porin